MITTADRINDIEVLPTNIFLDEITGGGGLTRRKPNSGSFVPTHGMHRTAFYNIYRGIEKRCNLKSHKSYGRYGGRGIKCLWPTFEAFRDDMYESYKEHKNSNANTSIERINNEGDYCKENCRWATAKEQARNRSNNNLVTYGGQTKTVSEWVSEIGMRHDTFLWRLNRWGVCDKLFKRPKDRKNAYSSRI